MTGRDQAAGALANGAIRALLSAFAAVMFSEWALIAAISFHAYQTNGALAVGLLGLRFVPAAGVGLIAERVIERREPAALLRLVALSRTLFIGAVAVALIRDASYPVVLALIVVDGAVAALYRPAQSALLPSLAATPAELTAAAALLGTVKTLSQVAGALLGGVVVVAASASAVGTSAALLMAVAALVVPHRAMRVRLIQHARFEDARRAAGFTPGAIHVAALAGLRALVRGLWLALVVVVAIRMVDLGASGVGTLMAASAAGTIVALPIAISLIGTARLGAGLGIALATAGAPLAALTAWHEPGVAIVLIAIHGVGMSVAETASLGLLHRLLDARGVSGIVGPMESGKLALEGAGSLLAPALIALAGTRGALLVAGLLPLLMVAVDWRALVRIDAEAGARTRLVELLRSIDIFRPLPVAALEELAGRVRRETFAPGESVIVEGERGDTYYAIERGRAEVSIDGFAIAHLERGTGFGERALLRNDRRAATVRAVDDLSVFAVDRDVFLAAVAGGNLRQDDSLALAPRPLLETLRGQPLFARASRSELERLAHLCELQDWDAGAAVVRQGETGERFYLLLSGRAEIDVDGVVVGALRAGDSFGEIALLHDVPRRATVVVRERARTAALARDDFAAVVADSGLAARPAAVDYA